jgi:hypothetical protein
LRLVGRAATPTPEDTARFIVPVVEGLQTAAIAGVGEATLQKNFSRTSDRSGEI